MNIRRPNIQCGEADFTKSVESNKSLVDSIFKSRHRKHKAKLLQRYEPFLSPEIMPGIDHEDAKERVDALRIELVDLIDANMKNVTKRADQIKAEIIKIEDEIKRNVEIELHRRDAAIEKYKLKVNARKNAPAHIQAELTNALNNAIKRFRSHMGLADQDKHPALTLIEDDIKNFHLQSYAVQIDIINVIFDRFFSFWKGAHHFATALYDSIKAMDIENFIDIDDVAITGGRELSISEDDIDELETEIRIKAEKDASQKKVAAIYLAGIQQLEQYKKDVILPAAHSPDATFDSLEAEVVAMVAVSVRQDAKHMLDTANAQTLKMHAIARCDLLNRDFRAYLPPEATFANPSIKNLAEIMMESELRSCDVQLPVVKARIAIMQDVEKTTEVLKKESDAIRLVITDTAAVTKESILALQQATRASLDAINQSQLERLQLEFKKQIAKRFTPALNKLQQIEKVLAFIKAENILLEKKKGIFLFQESGIHKAQHIDQAIFRAVYLHGSELLKYIENPANTVEMCIHYVMNTRFSDERSIVRPSINESMQEKRGFFASPMRNKIETRIKNEILQHSSPRYTP